MQTNLFFIVNSLQISRKSGTLKQKSTAGVYYYALRTRAGKRKHEKVFCYFIDYHSFIDIHGL